MSIYALATLVINGPLPNVRFFEPTDSFRAWMEKQTKKLIDCGAGVGLLSHLYPDRVLSIDLLERDDPVGQVMVGMDATTFPFTKGMIALICRPNHSGWCYDTIKHALESGAEAIYVGLDKNLIADICGSRREMIIKNAGKEGERAWQVLNVP